MANRNNVVRLTDAEKSLIEMIRNDIKLDSYTDIRQALEMEAREIDKLNGLGERASMVREFARLIGVVWQEK
jgi:hypothetical protein